MNGAVKTEGVKAQKEEACVKPESAKAMVNGKPRILIVDDEKQVREQLTAILTTLDCVIETAVDGQDAIQKANAHPPDLIMLDLLMPVMDGYEASQVIRRRHHNRALPILFMTEWHAEDDCVRAFDFDCVDFLEKPFQPVEVITRCKSLLNLKEYEQELETAEGVVQSLALAVEARDPTTGDHCDRLFFRLAKLTDLLQLGNGTKDTLLKGSMLHDIGKVGIPDQILLKEGPLTNQEWAIMKRHVIIGEELCRPLKTLKPVLPIIRHHHERFDGSGYPDGLKGEEIPLVARVFQVCDIFDALTNPRPYKPAFSKDESIRILAGETERGWWDPRIVKVFLRMISEESLP